MAQRKPKADARAATITVTFASGVTGGEAKIGTAVTITTSVAAATLTEVDWGDGTTDTSTTHTYERGRDGPDGRRDRRDRHRRQPHVQRRRRGHPSR